MVNKGINTCLYEIYIIVINRCIKNESCHFIPEYILTCDLESDILGEMKMLITCIGSEFRTVNIQITGFLDFES